MHATDETIRSNAITCLDLILTLYPTMDVPTSIFPTLLSVAHQIHVLSDMNIPIRSVTTQEALVKVLHRLSLMPPSPVYCLDPHALTIEQQTKRPLTDMFTSM